MKYSSRMVLFSVGAAGIALLLIAAFVHLPGPEDIRSRYLGADKRSHRAEAAIQPTP